MTNCQGVFWFSVAIVLLAFLRWALFIAGFGFYPDGDLFVNAWIKAINRHVVLV